MAQGKVTLSFHVCCIPCQEECYMGVNADYEAFFLDIPEELFPKRLLDVIRDRSQYPNKVVTGIAVHKD